MTRGTQVLAHRRGPDVRDNERFDDQVADKNVSTVKEALDELDRRIHPSLGACPHFKSCWEQVGHVRSLVSALRPVRKKDRDRLLSRLQELCDALKCRQGEHWLERRVNSDRIRAYVLNDYHSARLSAEGARDAGGLRQAEVKVQQIRERLNSRDRDSWGAQLLKEARDDCWEAHRQAREALHLCRVRMQDLEYSRLRGPVAAAEADAGHDNPFEALIRIRGLQRDLSQAFLSRDQREDLKSALRIALDKASVRAGEHRQKRRERLSSTQSMFEEIIGRRRLTIRKLEATIYDLRGKAIWSDEYRERLARWVSERERRISVIEAEIRELEEKLVSVRERLSRS